MPPPPAFVWYIRSMNIVQDDTTGNLFVFGTAQVGAKAGRKPDEVPIFTRDELVALVDKCARGEHARIPFVYDHAGENLRPLEDGQCHAPESTHMGYMLHGAVDKRGQLLVVAHLDGKHPDTQRVRERVMRGEVLGLSIGLNYHTGYAWFGNKKLDHIGITDDPMFGGAIAADGQTGHGTYLHFAAATPGALAREIQPYLTEEGMHVPDAARAL
jgi:hypothetical protein